MKRKILYFIIPLSVVFAVTGCNKFIDRKPLGQAIDGDITQGGVEPKVFGLYGKMKTEWLTVYHLPFMEVHGARADDVKSATPTDGGDGDIGNFIDRYQYSKDQWVVNSNWSARMGVITEASNIIFEVDSAYSTDAPSLINKGEACFIRAMMYFDMVRDYGAVPLINFPVRKESDANVAKSSVAAIYQQIDNDLAVAETYLPLTWESKYLGRLTKGAANTLHAKTYLYRQNWSSALGKCEEVINSGVYSLNTDYKLNFQEEGENGVESIWEIQNYESANGSIVSSNEIPNYGGLRGDGEWDLGWGWMIPDTILVNNAYETGDPRLHETVLFPGQSDERYNRIVPAFKGTSASTNNWYYWNKKVYTDPVRRAATGDRMGKWLNTIILRYADVLLMAAEAANELGGTANTTKSLAWLEMIRARARNGNNAILPPVTSTNKDVIRTAIKKERRVEFAMEYERFYDLVRWIPATDGIDAIQVLGPLGYTTKNKYLPIPQPEIDKSGGVLIQNSDY